MFHFLIGPDGWVILKSSTNISRCYLFSNAASTTDYNTARSRCQAYAGDLMVINDAAEYNALLAIQTLSLQLVIGSEFMALMIAVVVILGISIIG